MALYEVVMAEAGDWSHGKNYVEAESIGDVVDVMQAYARKFDRTGGLREPEELEELGDDSWFKDHQFTSITMIDELPVIRELVGDE